MRSCDNDVVVMGAGLAGLSAGHALTRAGAQVRILEQGPAVGGLARTVESGPFRFDLGGHRLFTADDSIRGLVEGLLGEESSTVARKSQIFLRGRYIDYPLRPFNAMSGLGARTAMRIALDQLRRREGAMVSLEDWVVAHFGRTLFDIYFKPYSEKVWGLGCQDISMDWVAQRIQGLSLGAALKNALLRGSGRSIRTLADSFVYPRAGIGRIAERLCEEVQAQARNDVVCNIEVSRLYHDGRSVWSAALRDGVHTSSIRGRAFVSTVPITALVRMLDPKPPAAVLRAAGSLRFRDLVVVAVMLHRRRATAQSWLYFPDHSVSFGRIHEPTNWSAAMAPPGKTLLVAERFCFRGDDTWESSDGELAGQTVDDLHRLGIVSRSQVIGSSVVRVPKAYPLFAVGYREHCEAIRSYLGRFTNLFTAGRGGTFSYFNMDHAMASGTRAAGQVLALLQSEGLHARQSA
ncbi:MAG TPA: FAD-dependent oxidoreductase [Myxococcales bacterium]